jgi:tetratricopeptide (TPR) repeat protein
LKLARALLLCCLAWPTANAANNERGQHPLLDLARELEESRDPAPQFEYSAPDLRAAEHALEQARPPPDADCARSIGAAVFSNLHSEVARALEARGEFARAAQAYRRALACTPRDTRVLSNLAEALFDARDLAGAREQVRRALAINPRAVHLTRVAANIDFIEERWADAVAGFRYTAASEPDRVRAAYPQLMYWLAQKRAGVHEPEFVARRHTEDWPKPLLLYLQDQYTEAELVAQVREGTDEYASVSRDERLCEALFYVGEAHWARGDPGLARDYFAAAVNIKLIRYREHGLAMAEIAKLRAR